MTIVQVIHELTFAAIQRGKESLAISLRALTDAKLQEVKMAYETLWTAMGNPFGEIGFEAAIAEQDRRRKPMLVVWACHVCRGFGAELQVDDPRSQAEAAHKRDPRGKTCKEEVIGSFPQRLDTPITGQETKISE